MKINLKDLVCGKFGISEHQYEQMMGQEMIYYVSKPSDSKNIIKDNVIEVRPGDKIVLPGATHIYFAPATEEELKWLQVVPKQATKIEIPDGLTLDNHAELMGYRFKMTKEEKQLFGKLRPKEARMSAFRTRYRHHPLTGESV